ncbi:MAG: transposase [Calditrichaeota bacterium]|nr:transposase [Calditrichota bacterium]
MPKDFSKVKKIGYDETSRKKGHHYVSIFLDLESGALLWVEEGKSAQTVSQSVQAMEEQGFSKGNITDVSIDFSPAFQAGCQENFPNAMITFDKFHVCQLHQKAMNNARKTLARQRNQTFNKWLFLKPCENLETEQQTELEQLLDEFPKFQRLYTLKNDFAILWEQKQPDEAAAFLSF